MPNVITERRGLVLPNMSVRTVTAEAGYGAWSNPMRKH